MKSNHNCSMLFHDPDHSRWYRFRDPARILTSCKTNEVYDIFSELENAVNQGYYAARFIGYESAPAFDDALVTFPPGEFPLSNRYY